MWQLEGVSVREEGPSEPIYGLGGMWSSLLRFGVDLEEFRDTFYFGACGAHFSLIVGPHVYIFTRGHMDYFILVFRLFYFSF